ncbi:MAG: arylsulfatase [Flavobacteriales bacterium]|nr:MAG: arylsulfatase [Flavobacteriales bacterium]
MKSIMKPTALLGMMILIGCGSPSVTPKRERPPNIVLILGDDMGYSDIGSYGGEINTPRLDALAANGLRFTQFYNTARCCPTRASLLTGLYPQQAGVGHMVNDRGTPAFRGDLSKHAVTIAEALKGAGYDTYMSGKWHVTPYVIENPNKENWPRQRGFDRFFGMISGAGSLYDPRSLAEDNDYVAPREGFYGTTDFSDYAVKSIEEHQGDQPFFLYLAYTAAHWPMQAPAGAIAKYKGHYDTGWDAMREARFDRMKKMGLAKTDWAMTPRDSFVTKWSEDIPDRAWELANMETYAAMTTLMDEGIGRVVDALEAKGQLDNTIIFYLQDNGACAEELEWLENRPAVEDPKPMAPDELQTETIPYVTRDGKPVKIMKAAWPGPPEGFTAYGLNWANASNTPFREYKHWVNEGGISTPLIVHWPAKIKSGGEFRTATTHLIDIMATCVEVAGATYPARYNGNSIQPLEGKSLVPVLEGKDLVREALYWEHEGNRAVRMGKWKLISKASKKQPYLWDKVDELALSNWELFDMEHDRTEMQDIASDHPELAKKMAAMWLVWAKRTGIVPRPPK